MSDAVKEFYDEWAACQEQDSLREIHLHWKAAHPANLFRKEYPELCPDSICEIGGAEGTVLHAVEELLGAPVRSNYDLSERFATTGRKRYPEISFNVIPFEAGAERYDIAILSDILEHVEDDAALLELVASRCRWILAKLPVEVCLKSRRWFYRVRGKRKPHDLEFGPIHFNGPLRGYTLREGRALLARIFSILQVHSSDLVFSTAVPGKMELFRKITGTYFTIFIFGGCLFLLGESRRWSGTAS